MSDNQQVIGLINPKDYPDASPKLIEEFNRKLLRLSEENARLTHTVSKKDQFAQTRIANVLRIYNINITKNIIEDEIYQNQNNEELAVLKNFNLPCPCDFTLFLDATKNVLSSEKEREKYLKYFNRDRLLKEFKKGNLEQSLSYENFLPNGKKQQILHKLYLTKEPDTKDIVAMCSARDITSYANSEKKLSEAQNKIDTSLLVIEGLMKEYHSIWLVDSKDFSTTLFKSTENQTLSDALEIGRKFRNYKDIFELYVSKFVVPKEQERVRKEASIENVMKTIEDNEVFTINYLRYDENHKETYQQMAFVKGDDKHFIMAFRNVDKLLRTEIDNVAKAERLKQYEADLTSLELIHESLNSGSIEIDFKEDGSLKKCTFSKAVRKMTGYSTEKEFPDQLESLTDLIYVNDRERVLKNFWDSVNDKTGKIIFDEEFQLFTKDKGLRWFLSTGRISRKADGKPVKFVGLIFDNHENKIKSETIKEQLRIVQALSRDYLNVYSMSLKERTARVIKLEGYETQGIKDYKNDKFPYDAMVRRYVRDRVLPEDQERLLKEMSIENIQEKLSASPEYVQSYRVLLDGEIHFFQFKFIRLDDSQMDTNIIAGFKNVDAITHAAKEREELILLSETDRMTGLLNRVCGENRVSKILDTHPQGMLCIMDIDNFKQFNDKFGHDAGDKVIIGTAKCINEAFRDQDIKLRLGGDEFVIFAQNVQSESQGKEILQRFFEKLSKLDIPEIYKTPVTASVGATILQNDSQKPFEELYKLIDHCLYESKKTKGDIITFGSI